MMLYFSGVAAACFLVLTMTGVLSDVPDVEQGALICLAAAAVAGGIAFVAEVAARAQDSRNAGPARDARENI
jgi:hypothetical protein